VTYGKVIGHGMPIGAVCGRAELLAGYGDSPSTEQSPSLFGAVGTFNGNPLSMAAGTAALGWLSKNKAWFYPKLYAMLDKIASRMNAFVDKAGYHCQFVSSDDRAHIYCSPPAPDPWPLGTRLCTVASPGRAGR
jgi:glutamate-1-semialdehyde aminotransferase